jgi:hypothetical protein
VECQRIAWLDGGHRQACRPQQQQQQSTAAADDANPTLCECMGDEERAIRQCIRVEQCCARECCRATPANTVGNVTFLAYRECSLADTKPSILGTMHCLELTFCSVECHAATISKTLVQVYDNHQSFKQKEPKKKVLFQWK